MHAATRLDRDTGTLAEEKATADDIRYCFRLILGRDPNPEEWQGHATRVGEDLKSVVTSYLTSAEFAARNMLASPDAMKLSLTDYGEFRVYTHADDLSVGIHVAARNYEKNVQRIFHQHLRAGMTVLDIGANLGFFSLLSAAVVGASGRVIAIEPNSFNVKLIEASRRENDFSNIEIHNIAADTNPGLLVLNTSHSNGTVSNLSTELDALMLGDVVPAQTIDTIVNRRHVDFVKIDVEGAELKALMGAEQTLRRSRPVIVSEFSHTAIPEGGGAYLSWLIELGYKIGVIELDGTVTDCGVEKSKVVDAFWKSGVDHIDVVANPLRRSWWR